MSIRDDPFNVCPLTHCCRTVLVEKGDGTHADAKDDNAEKERRVATEKISALALQQLVGPTHSQLRAQERRQQQAPSRHQQSRVEAGRLNVGHSSREFGSRRLEQK